ncbi:MAG: peptidase [Gammaproteobacteria bacterium]|nr:MAG: peptidase [Gammaproteobacteria bacterium]
MFLIVGILSFGLVWVVRSWMLNRYRRWGSEPNGIGATGFEVARYILDRNGLRHVMLDESPGQLTDHYIPSQKRIRLSDTIGPARSIAALAVAAHEVGHAIQDGQGYAPLKAKAVLMPIAATGNQMGMMMALGGGFLGLPNLLNIGVALLFSGVFIQLLTLPIEFDASRRAMAELERLKLVNAQDREGAASMLKAAALTYVASAVTSLGFLLVFAMQFLRRR